MQTITDRIAAAIDYLHAEAPDTQTYTLSADVLRTLGQGRAIAMPINGGCVVAGIVSDGSFLPPSGGPRKATLTIRAASGDAEMAMLLAALRAAVAKRRPSGSAYDPSMAASWDAYRQLVEELAA